MEVNQEKGEVYPGDVDTSWKRLGVTLGSGVVNLRLPRADL